MRSASLPSPGKEDSGIRAPQALAGAQGVRGRKGGGRVTGRYHGCEAFRRGKKSLRAGPAPATLESGVISFYFDLGTKEWPNALACFRPEEYKIWIYKYFILIKDD